MNNEICYRHCYFTAHLVTRILAGCCDELNQRGLRHFRDFLDSDRWLYPQIILCGAIGLRPIREHYNMRWLLHCDFEKKVTLGRSPLWFWNDLRISYHTPRNCRIVDPAPSLPQKSATQKEKKKIVASNISSITKENTNYHFLDVANALSSFGIGRRNTRVVHTTISTVARWLLPD